MWPVQIFSHGPIPGLFERDLVSQMGKLEEPSSAQVRKQAGSVVLRIEDEQKGNLYRDRLTVPPYRTGRRVDTPQAMGLAKTFLTHVWCA